MLRRKKLRRYVDLEVVAAYIDLLRREAELAPDPEMPAPVRCKEPDDKYLISLAHDQNAALISGDRQDPGFLVR